MTQSTGWQTPIERKRDWAREAEQVFWLGAAVLIAWVVGRVAWSVIGPVAAQVPAMALGITALAGSIPAGAQLSAADDHVTVVLADPTAGERLLAVLAVVPQPLVLATVLALLARWARSVRQGATFAASAASRLTRIGQVTVLAGIGAYFLETTAASMLRWDVLPNGVASSPSPASVLSSVGPALWWPTIGACLGLVGEIVRRGVALRDELEGVI